MHLSRGVLSKIGRAPEVARRGLTTRVSASQPAEVQSRNSNKRDAQRLLQLARELCDASTKKLGQLERSADLPSEIYEAVILAQGIDHRNQGRKRQVNYVAGLLRELDPGEQQRIKGIAKGLLSGAEVGAERRASILADAWLKGILAEDSALLVLQEVVEELDQLPPTWQELQQARHLARRCLQLRSSTDAEDAADQADGAESAGPSPASQKAEKRLRAQLRELALRHLRQESEE